MMLRKLPEVLRHRQFILSPIVLATYLYNPSFLLSHVKSTKQLGIHRSSGIVSIRAMDLQPISQVCMKSKLG